VEKTGVEKEIVEEKEVNGIKRVITKKASLNTCPHPENKVVAAGDMKYCRRCEKYLQKQ
jgi:hypothetical protein